MSSHNTIHHRKRLYSKGKLERQDFIKSSGLFKVCLPPEEPHYPSWTSNFMN